MKYSDLFIILNHEFKDLELLEEALTHPSTDKEFSYERLEFLGDSVLGMIIADMLFNTFPDNNEGDLSRKYVELVRKQTLYEISLSLNLGPHMIMADGEKMMGGQTKISNLENVLESLIGALYIDGGLYAAQTFIKAHWTERLLGLKIPPKNPKTALQEWAQQNGLPIPNYAIIDRTGPDHQPIFTMKVELPGHNATIGVGSTKRNAEESAAKVFLETMGLI